MLVSDGVYNFWSKFYLSKTWTKNLKKATPRLSFVFTFHESVSGPIKLIKSAPGADSTEQDGAKKDAIKKLLQLIGQKFKMM
jgi:hypothetical protein